MDSHSKSSRARARAKARIAPPAEVRPAGSVASLSAEDGADHARVRAALGGDERAFEELVQRHQQRVFRLARNLVGSDDDARDLAQEAFLRVFRSLSSFDFQHPFGTWLARIATNLAIDHLRRRRPLGTGWEEEREEGETASPLEQVESREPAPERRLDADETAAAVRDCLDSLAPHFSSVLVLRELEGLPCNEIAPLVGATHVTVRWRLHRGRKLFLEEWERRQRANARANNPVVPTVDPTGRSPTAPL